ncbi:hypothetical protein R1flu_004779 [Riccia fluitans]|uniref:Desiccation-related protein PCC13-62 n=1 Tax=Riccia fluitans TaxID=41844 RepID=A0ABD1YRM6_9MARC
MEGGKMMGILALVLLLSSWAVQGTSDFTITDKDTLAVALNLEYLEAEFFLFGAYGKGLDHFSPELADGGPTPKGGEKADLDPIVRELVEQFGLQEVGHIRAIKEALGKEGFPRPELNFGKEVWAQVFDDAFGYKLDPPFNPYKNSVNYMLASYGIPYVGLTGYTGGAHLLEGPGAKSLAARLLGVEAGQDASIRTWLYLVKDKKVEPYDFTVAEATVKLSKLRNKLDGAEEVNDEGLIVPKELGAEQAVEGNVLAGDKDSLAYTRTPKQIFSVVYASGDPSKPGGFYPKGALGRHAQKYLSTYESVKQTLNPFLESEL